MTAPSVHVNSDPAFDVPRALIRRGVSRTLSREGAGEGEVSVSFVGDDAIAELNRGYLGREGPTDVIAFSLHEPDDPLLGDVYVGYEQARRQARELGVPLAEELVRLAVHGTLHVLGYEHPEGPGREESELFRRQEAIVREVAGERAGG